MLLQTNSYIVPKEKRAEHARLIRRFRQTLARLGCTHFEVYEQVGSNWNSADTSGRFVQIMRFDDRRQQQAIQQAERVDPGAQAVIAEFCELINFPYQQQQGLFAVGFYTSALPPGRSGSAAQPAPLIEQAPASDTGEEAFEESIEEPSAVHPAGEEGSNPTLMEPAENSEEGHAWPEEEPAPEAAEGLNGEHPSLDNSEFDLLDGDAEVDETDPPSAGSLLAELEELKPDIRHPDHGPAPDH